MAEVFDRYFFGCEADDVSIPWAFSASKEIKFHPVFGSDIGHFDVTDMAGLDITVISYKGEGVTIPAIAANEIQLALMSGAIKPQIDSGRVVALATTGAQRWEQFPNVPTMVEAGFPALNNIGFWLGIVAPVDIPKDVTMKLNSAFNGTLKAPEVAKRIRDLGVQPLGGTPDEFTALPRRSGTLGPAGAQGGTEGAIRPFSCAARTPTDEYLVGWPFPRIG